MPDSSKPQTPPKGTAVDDEDPKTSPMDQQPGQKGKNPSSNDQPGADGPSSAGANEDTYD